MKKPNIHTHKKEIGFGSLKASLLPGINIDLVFCIVLMKLYPFTQEHTMIGYRDNLYIFGGEVGFSNGVETPLWMYNITVGKRMSYLIFNSSVRLKCITSHNIYLIIIVLKILIIRY